MTQCHLKAVSLMDTASFSSPVSNLIGGLSVMTRMKKVISRYLIPMRMELFYIILYLVDILQVVARVKPKRVVELAKLYSLNNSRLLYTSNAK